MAIPVAADVPGFRPGQRVTVVRGPLKAMSGVIINVNEARRLYMTSGGSQAGSVLAEDGWEWVALTVTSNVVPMRFQASQLALTTN
jgi:transcription antitermination factor NusG